MNNRNNIIEEYYRSNYNSLIKYARSKFRNDLFLAEDAVQEAFTRALKYFDTFKLHQDMNRWFGRILINSINYIKSQQRDQGVTVPEHLEDEEAQRRLRAVNMAKEIASELKHVSERDREILEAYFIYGLKTREISEVINVGHGNVRYIISKFRERLQT